WARGAAVAPHCYADQAGGSQGEGIAGADTGADPALVGQGEHAMKPDHAALIARASLALVTLGWCLGFATATRAADYAGAISAYRRAHGLSAVRLDRRLDMVARRQALAMAASGTVSHSVGGLFTVRVARLRKAFAA